MPTTDSAPVTGTLILTGTWLHDPDDPGTSVINFRYGPPREHSVDAAGAGTLYAGRTYPVTDYGEHESEEIALSLQVPHGSTYRAELVALEVLARGKRTVWYRDNRGRSFAGTLGPVKLNDQRWGSLVSFTVSRVHYAVEEVAA
jgi:hypothetical protein